MAGGVDFWVWRTQCKRPEEEMLQGTHAAITNLITQFDQGKLVTEPFPLITMRRRTEHKGRLTDNLFAPGMRSLVWSSRLRSLLHEQLIDNIQYFPLRLGDSHDGSINDDYRLANIIGRVECIDMAASSLEMNPDDKSEIEFINSIVLKSEFRTGESDLKLFREDRYFPLIFAHDDIKKACEDNNITGVSFMRPEDFYT